MNEFERNILRLWPSCVIPPQMPHSFDQHNIITLLKHNGIQLPNHGMMTLSHDDLQWASIVMSVCISSYQPSEIQHPTLIIEHGIPTAICGLKWFHQQWWTSIVGYNNHMLPYSCVPLAKHYLMSHNIPLLPADTQNLWMTHEGQDIHEVDSISGTWKFFNYILPQNITHVTGKIFHWNAIPHQCIIDGTLITKTHQSIPHLLVQ
jgi:hypothetical protein